MAAINIRFQVGVKAPLTHTHTQKKGNIQAEAERKSWSARRWWLCTERRGGGGGKKVNYALNIYDERPGEGRKLGTRCEGTVSSGTYHYYVFG